MTNTMNGGNGALATPERNNFFYGKLMDVPQFEKEQRYFNQKRWLLNQLVLGSGVVCGLDVVQDSGSPERVRIQPGIAIDALGREIIVPEAVLVNPRQLTNDQGTQTRDPNDTTGTVEICLAYAENCTDLVPVLMPDCDTPGNCAPSTVRESFHILVRQAEGAAPKPSDCTLPAFPLPADGALHALLCERIDAPCLKPPADICVPLARVTIAGTSIDACAGRRLIYGNALLYELILCLAGRVEQLAGAHFLRYVSGDGQSGPAGGTLGKPLVVEIDDGAGNPVKGVFVHFDVTTGDGTVKMAPALFGKTATVTSDDNGRAQIDWMLGTAVGDQSVTAYVVGTAFTVTFHATAT